METLDNSTMDGNQVTAKMKKELKETAPWMKFMGILMMIAIGLGILGMLFALIYTFHIIVLISLLVYIGMFYIGLVLFNVGNGYSNYVASGSISALEKAFTEQKKYWMIVGILTIIMILLYVVAIVIGYNMGGSNVNNLFNR